MNRADDGLCNERVRELLEALWALTNVCIGSDNPSVRYHAMRAEILMERPPFLRIVQQFPNDLWQVDVYDPERLAAVRGWYSRGVTHGETVD